MTDLPDSTGSDIGNNVGRVRWAPAPLTTIESDDDDFGPASPRHAKERRSFWQRSVDYGHDALVTQVEISFTFTSKPAS